MSDPPRAAHVWPQDLCTLTNFVKATSGIYACCISISLDAAHAHICESTKL